MESPSRRRVINLACWPWPGYPAINQGYKTIVKIVVLAQIFVKPWSWVLKRRGWLEITSIYLTLVWSEVLFKILILETMTFFRWTSVTSQILSFKRHASEKLNPWPTYFFLFTCSPISWSLKKFKNWNNQSLYSWEILKVLDVSFYSNV